MADNSHLNDREFAQALVEVSGRARIHLEQCAACREEFDCWQQSLALMPGSVRAAAELPPDFWQDQRFAIARMLRSAPAPGRLHWSCSSAACCCWATAQSPRRLKRVPIPITRCCSK